MTSIGRNDPCPCGSGAKHKKCCLAREAGGLSAADDQSARAGAMAKLLRFSERPQFDMDLRIGSILFWADRLDELSEADAQALVDDPDSEVKFNAWFLFDLDIDGGRTVADMFLAQKGASLPATERSFLDRMRHSHLALYEVTSVEPGQGVHVRDLWTGAGTFVVEHAASRDLARWDVLGARVVPDSVGSARFEGGLYLYPVKDKAAILRELKRHHRRFVKHGGEADPAAFFRRHGMVFNYLWLEYVVQRPMPTVVTMDGDEIVFAKVVFDVINESRLLEALRARGDVVSQPDGSFVWLEGEGDDQRLLGTFILKGKRIRLETMSKPRAERGRQWLEALAGDAVRYHATSYESVVSALEQRARQTEPELTADVPPEIAADMIQTIHDRHYRAWVDQPIPDLNNKTPRVAAKSRALRPRVVDILKQLENHAERDRLAGRPSYDSDWLWTELGLAHPNS